MLFRGPRAFVAYYLAHGAGEYEVHVEYAYAGHPHTLELDKRWRFRLN